MLHQFLYNIKIKASKRSFLFGRIKNMKTTSTNNLILNNHIIRIALGTAFILMIPLVMMQFSSEVDWKLADFIVIGTLLFGSGILYELIASKVRNKNHRISIGIAIAAAVLYIWAELAVGIFTTLGS